MNKILQGTPEIVPDVKRTYFSLFVSICYKIWQAVGSLKSVLRYRIVYITTTTAWISFFLYNNYLCMKFNQ